MKKFFVIGIFLLTIFPFLSKADLGRNNLRITLQSSKISLDPGGIQDSQSWFVSRQVNCQLVRSQGATFVLDAAESIKYVTPLKILLKINTKAKFHDGTPVTAQDVMASLNYIKESRNILGNLFIWIKKIDILDERTILFTLNKQVPQFLKVLSSTNYTIFKKEFLNNAKKDKNLWKKPLGCGGYKVSEYNNEYIKLIPISNGLPITFYLSKGNQIDSSELKKYDIVTVNVIGDKKELNSFNIIEMFDPLQFYVGLNSKSQAWKTKDERCKFLSKLDIENLIMYYGGSIIKANDFLPKGTLGYSRNENFNTQFSSLSKETIDKKKISYLRPFCLSYLSVSIQEKYKNEYLKMFKKIYPNVYIYPIVDVKKFGKDFVNRNCDAILFAWKSNYLDGYEYLTMFEGDANFTGIQNKILSDKIIKSQDILNAKERAQEYREIIKNINDLCIVRPLFTLPLKKIYVRKNLKTPGIGLVSIYQYYLGNITR